MNKIIKLLDIFLGLFLIGITIGFVLTIAFITSEFMKYELDFNDLNSWLLGVSFASFIAINILIVSFKKVNKNEIF